jgi:hypothetical protein
MGGWVEKRERRVPPCRGFTIKRWAVAGLASIGILSPAYSSFSRA